MDHIFFFDFMFLLQCTSVLLLAYGRLYAEFVSSFDPPDAARMI